MFEALKKKFLSWVKKPEPEKKIRKKKQKEKKIEKRNTRTLAEKESDEQVAIILKETETAPEQIKEVPEEKENFFTRLVKKITVSKLTKEQLEESFAELEIILLQNNVALKAVDTLKEKLAEQLVGQQMKKTEAPARVLQALKDSILSILIEPQNLIEQINKKGERGPYIIIFFGINGTGKTTSIAKIGYLLKKHNISVLMAAADTFRAASIEQLKTHGQKLNIPVISSQYGSDPASVAFDAIKYAKTHNVKVVLVDTAGRMYTKVNLLKEMEKIIRISQPDLKIFVGESITGNDVINQASTFNESVGIDGIILSKADIDEKAGAILSVSHVTGKPIYFLGVGQKYEDLVPFTKKTVLKNLGLE